MGSIADIPPANTKYDFQGTAVLMANLFIGNFARFFCCIYYFLRIVDSTGRSDKCIRMHTAYMASNPWLSFETDFVTGLALPRLASAMAGFSLQISPDRDRGVLAPQWPHPTYRRLHSAASPPHAPETTGGANGLELVLGSSGLILVDT